MVRWLLLKMSSEMGKKEMLLDALRYYDIEIIDERTNKIQIGRGFIIEIESNGLYKLFADGQVIAPFDDLDELCRFVLM